MSEEKKPKFESPKKRRQRSPNHPSFTLKTAIEKTGMLWKKYGRQGALLKNACEAMGYSSVNSTANQCVATLKSFGLVETSGSGANRKAAVSDIGEHIVRNAPDREELVKKAASTPAIHQEIIEHYNTQGGIPHDDILRAYLVWERPEGQRFNEEAVDGFMERLRETLGYAGVGNLDKVLEDSKAEKTVNIGDYVQWTSQGVDQFQKPQMVLSFSEDGDFAFVKTTKAGIPMSELTIVEQPPVGTIDTTPQAVAPTNPHFQTNNVTDLEPKAGFVKDQKSLKEGSVVIEWPDTLSAESCEDFEYWIEGLVRSARRKAGLPPEKGK